MKKGDYRKLYYDELRTGRNKRRYSWHEGRKNAYYICFWNDDDELQSITKFSTKQRPDKKAKIRGPRDLIESKEFTEILNGKKLDYPYLSDIENRVLTMRALGVSRAKIARALSGGGKSYATSNVKYLLQTARQKIRENENMARPKKKISVDLDERTVSEADRCAKHLGKTRGRIIHEALVEWIYENAPPDVWKTKHFEIDFNRFNKLERWLMDLQNRGVVAVEDDGRCICEDADGNQYYEGAIKAK